MQSPSKRTRRQPDLAAKVFILLGVAAWAACPKAPAPSEEAPPPSNGRGGAAATAEGGSAAAAGGSGGRAEEGSGGAPAVGGSGGAGAGTGGAIGSGGAAGTSGTGGGGGIADDGSAPGTGGAGVDPGPQMIIAAAGDIAAATDGDEKTTATLLHKIHAETPLKAILMLGDGAYRFAGLAEYNKLYEPTWGVPEFKAITYPIPGNHEYLNTTTGQGYFDYWNGIGKATGKAGERGKGYYSFDLGAWHFIALNSNDDCKHVACGAGSPQLTWLEADLAAHPALCTLVMVHAPRFQSGTHRGDTPALQAAWAAMYAAGVDLVLAAHEHNFQQFAPMDATGKRDMDKGIRSFVVGTGGGRDFRAVFTTAHMATEEKRIVNESGVMFLTLGAKDYSFRWLHADGRVGATGSGTCH
jgi:hypothetical protein